MVPEVITSFLRLFLGTLYPAYSSYKAVRTKNVREYVKWMMYWIVFALFTSMETFTDIFVAFWFPFYYELKIIVLIWLISPVSKGSLGSSIIYRKFVHPALMKREEEIDVMIERLQEQGYNTVTRLGMRAFNCVSETIMQTALRVSVMYLAVNNHQVQVRHDHQQLQQQSIDTTDFPKPRFVEVEDVDMVTSVKEPFDQNDLIEETDRSLDPGPKITKKAKARASKAKKSGKKKAADKSQSSSDVDLSSDNDADMRDMDVDVDPEVTMAMEGPLRSQNGENVGVTTRTMRTRKAKS